VGISLWLVYLILSWVLVVILDSFDKGKLKRDDENIAHQYDSQEASVVEVGIPIAGPISSTAVAGLSVPVHSLSGI